jgi:hypothetical protein
MAGVKSWKCARPRGRWKCAHGGTIIIGFPMVLC